MEPGWTKKVGGANHVNVADDEYGGSARPGKSTLTEQLGASGDGDGMCRPGLGQGQADAPVGTPQPTLRLVRIHNPARFEDPVATTLYPGDWLRVHASFDAGDRTHVTGRLVDDRQLLKTVSTSSADSHVTVEARAEREGATLPRLELTPARGAPTTAALPRIEIVPALAGGRTIDTDDPRRVSTTNISDAIHLITNELDALRIAQELGVTQARASLKKHHADRSTPWWISLIGAGAEMALSFVTAGIGNALGRSLAGRAAAFRDVTIGQGDKPLKIFDLESAFGTSMKDTLKLTVKRALDEKDHARDDVLSEIEAINAFCDIQTSALQKTKADLAGYWINHFDQFRALETSHPGRGLAEIEAQRHAIAVESERVTDAQQHATIKEWLLYLARATHGVVANRHKPGDDATDLGHDGRGHMVVKIVPRLSDPATPVRVTAVGLPALADSAATTFHARGGALRSLGLPFQLVTAAFVIGRNEAGAVWITFTDLRYSSSEAKRYLFAKGTGRSMWQSESELEAGMQQGARRIAELEVGTVDIKSLDLMRQSES